MIGKGQQPLGVSSPAILHLANFPSSSFSGQSEIPSHNLSTKIGRVKPNLSCDKQLVTGFEGFLSSFDSHSDVGDYLWWRKLNLIVNITRADFDSTTILVNRI